MATAKKAAKKAAPKKSDSKKQAPAKKTEQPKQAPKPSDKKEAPKKAAKNEAKPVPAATSHPASEPTRIPLSIIIPDPNQPRKFFDEKGLQELAASIAQIDVIEPVLLRPANDGLFMLVVGERRVRSSRIAGKETIPAIIRVLTDEEAFEIQIAENLQRHDPHPMEEAFAFKKMLAKGMTVDEIALRVCKSDRFVAMRLMLNDLVADFQELFFANKMSLGQAMLLAKVDAAQQQTIFNDNVDSDWRGIVNYELDDIEYLVDRDEHNLTKAPFSLGDATLYPEMGSCSKCPSNSVNTLLLFVDGNEPMCNNATCYNIKCARAYKQKIEAAMLDTTLLFVAGHHYSESDKHKVKEVQELGITVIPYGKWKKCVEPEPVPSFEEYFEGQKKHFRDGVDMTEAETEARNDHEELIDDYNKEVIEYNEYKNKKLIKRAFIVVGTGEGNIIEVVPNVIDGTLELAEAEGLPADIASKIAELNKREERAQELDGEKVWKDVRELVEAEGDTWFKHDTELTTAEQSAFVFAIIETLGLEKDEFIDEVLQYQERGLTEAQAIESITQKHYNLLCRLFLKEKLFPTHGSHLTSSTNYGGFMLARAYFPDKVEGILRASQEKVVKRQKNLRNKIDDLKESVEELEEKK